MYIVKEAGEGTGTEPETPWIVVKSMEAVPGQPYVRYLPTSRRLAVQIKHR